MTTFAASILGTVATLTAHSNSGATAIRVEDAASLGDELLAFANDPATVTVDKAAYRLDPTDSGVRLTTPTGMINLPWRYLVSLGTILTA